MLNTGMFFSHRLDGLVFIYRVTTTLSSIGFSLDEQISFSVDGSRIRMLDFRNTRVTILKASQSKGLVKDCACLPLFTSRSLNYKTLFYDADYSSQD